MSGDGAKYEVIGQKFHISKGATKYCIKRVLIAVLSMRDSFIIWPNAEERQRIAESFLGLHGFPNCIGAIDGTYVGLCERPSWCGQDYYNRKCFYGVQAQIICDHNGRILDIYSGWPSSVHDNRVWRNSSIYKNPTSYFSNGQYLVSDSALTSSTYIVPAFKCGPGLSLTRGQEHFNFKLSQARIKIEHVNGLLKERFPILKRMNVKINTNRDVLKVLRIIIACGILHNFLLSDPFYSTDIIETMEDVVDEDETEVFGEVSASEDRRSQIYSFISEYYGFYNN